ncbi:MAG: response regulator [Opitutales bacterium]|nr:response regulator [Opitutales bacterium]
MSLTSEINPARPDIQATGLPILTLDADGFVVSCNAAWTLWRGDETPFCPLADLITNESMLPAILSEARENDFWEGEFFLRLSPDKEPRPCLARIDLHLPQGWSTPRFVCVLHDISSRKFAEASVRSLASVASNLPLALAHINQGGAIVFRNRDYIKLRNRLQTPLFSSLRARRVHALAIGRGKPLTFNSAYPDGTIVRWRAWPGPHNERCFVIGEEITQNVRLLEEQDAQTRLLAESAASLPVLFYHSVSEDGEITSLRWLGRHVDTLLGLGSAETIPLEDFTAGVHPADLARCLASFKVKSRGFARWQETYRYRHPKNDGEWRWHQTEAVPVKHYRKTVHWSGWIRDITEEVEIKAQLDRADRMETLRTLSGGLAHEFNNILAIISGWAEITLARAPEGPITDGLTKIAVQIDRGRDLVRRMSGLTRASEEGERLFEGTQLLKDVHDLAGALLPCAIDLRLSLPDYSCTLFADPQKIEQALLNLITNARDALPDGGQISLSVFQRSGASNVDEGEHRRVVFEVRDNGTGVPPEIREKIFEVLFTTKNERGSGLGLAMVHRIAQESNGHVVCLPTPPGEGAVFQLILPAADGVCSIDPEKSITGDAIDDTAGNLPNRTKKYCHTLLLIEDNAELCNLEKCAFESRGWRVFEAASIGAARKAFAAHHREINVVLCDWDLPGGSTRELLDEFRARTPDIPILVITGLLTTERIRSFKESGARRWLAKPAPVSKIIETTEALLPGSPHPKESSS